LRFAVRQLRRRGRRTRMFAGFDQRKFEELFQPEFRGQVMNRDPRSSHRGRDGSALLVVLVMLGVIAILAAAVARSVSGAALELSASRASAESDSDLRAGIELGVAAILKLGNDMRSAEASANLRGRRIAVRVTNERARIDLNRAKLDLLSGLLK